jgi:hypothetical protein
MIQKWAVATAVTAATVLGALAAPAQAATFNLQNLIDTEGSFTVADNTFSEFFCNVQFSTPGVTTPNNCSEIDVVTLNDGIKFQADFFADENSAIDVLLGYTVESPQPINNIGITFDGDFTGDALASVTETVRDAANDQIIGQFTVSNSPELTDLQDPQLEPLLQGDVALSRAVTKATVEKDILVNAFDGTASISMITQTYQIPEPGTIAGLLAVGSFGVGAILKRHRQNKS